MIEDKITQHLQCFQSSLANSPHNDILWTCLVFLAASRQVWTIYWIIHPALTVSCFILVFVINITKKVNDCCQWMFHFSHFSACSNLRVWQERRHPAPSSWQELSSQSEARVWARWPMRSLDCAEMVTTDASLESFKLSWWKMSYGSLGILPDMHFL